MASPSRTWAGAVLGCFAGALIRVLPLSLTGCNERCQRLASGRMGAVDFTSALHS